MSHVSLQMTYRDGKPFAAYIGLGRGLGERSVRSEELGPEIVVDYGEDGRPLGIEVIDPISASAEDISRLLTAAYVPIVYAQTYTDRRMVLE